MYLKRVKREYIEGVRFRGVWSRVYSAHSWGLGVSGDAVVSSLYLYK